ncbi:unnamed protein product [Callosobruchus maculatus]|uniref:Uncharacterized protein n=1 Tax=Callosobruchus maculatus TaxID=64391 RepID=A0A653CL67_CALMS|nr:unnamed protein product [Callosobruchus maculatus]
MNLSTFYSRRDSHPGTSMGGDPGTSQGHSRAPPLEAAAYYYGGPQGHHFHPTTPGGASVDELVAMWLSSGTAPSGSLDPEELSIEQHTSPHHSPSGSHVAATERHTPQESALSPSVREEENTNHSTLSMYPHPSNNNNMTKMQHRGGYATAGSPSIQMQGGSPMGGMAQGMAHSPSAVNQWLLSSGDKPMYPSMFGLLQGSAQSPQQQYPSATPSPAGTHTETTSFLPQLFGNQH